MCKKKVIKLAAVLVLFVSVTLSIWICKNNNAHYECTEYAMNTVIHISASGKNAQRAAEEVTEEIRKIDSRMSAHSKKSEIYQLNLRASKEPLKVSDEVFSLIKKSVYISEKTNGAFDITVKPLADVWNITSENPSLPSDEQISDALSKIGFRNIILDEKNKTVFFAREGMSLDLGAITKGYAADRAAEIFKKHNIKSALVDLGGNIYAVGKKTDGSKWKIGIQAPFKKRGEYFKLYPAEDTSIVTSGAYERYFEINGKIYHHILDPKTGYPAQSGIQSATVVCKNSVLADALSTAVYVLGKEESKSLTDIFDGIHIIILTDSGEIIEY